MELQFNTRQTEKLADFFFDVAKGFILGGVGFTVVAQQEQKIIYGIVSSVFAFWSMRTALKLLE